MSILVFDTRKNGGLLFVSESDVSTPPQFSIDQLVAGEVSTITFVEAYTPTLLAIDDGDSGIVNVSSFTGSGVSWSFTCPDLVDGVVGSKLGSVLVTVTDGVAALSPISSTYSKTGYTSVVLTSVAEGNIGLGFSPALEIGNQEAYDPSKGSISADGIFEGTVELFTGTQVAWDHNAIDFKWRSYEIETINGVPIMLQVVTAENRAHVGSGANLSTHQSVVVRWPLTVGSGDIVSILASDIGWYRPATAVANIPNSFTVVKAAIEDGTTSVPLFKGGSRTWDVNPGDNDTQTDLLTASQFSKTEFAQGSRLWYKAEFYFASASLIMPASQRNVSHVSGSQVRSFISADTTVTNGVDLPGAFTFSGVAPMTRTVGYCPFFLGVFK